MAGSRAGIYAVAWAHAYSRIVHIRSIEERWNDVAMWCNILLRCTNGHDFAAEQHDVGLLDSAALAVITRAEYSLAAWFRHVLIPPRDWIPIWRRNRTGYCIILNDTIVTFNVRLRLKMKFLCTLLFTLGTFATFSHLSEKLSILDGKKIKKLLKMHIKEERVVKIYFFSVSFRRFIFCTNYVKLEIVTF